MQSKIKARIILTGDSPLVCDNGEGADASTDINIQINRILEKPTAKWTEEDSGRMDLLKWRRGLYLDANNLPVFPSQNLHRCMWDTAKTFTKGMLIERGGVTFAEAEAPIVVFDAQGHEIPRRELTLENLWDNQRYRWRTVVNGTPTKAKPAKIVTVRPEFPKWALQYTAMIVPDIIDWEDFTRILDAAGNNGIGNGRKMGRGRFTAVAERL